MTTTESLMADLVAMVMETGTWQLTSDELSDRYDSVDAYRSLFQTGMLGTDEFGPDNVGELLIVLDELAGRDYRPAFRDVGLFLTHDDRLDLTERFVRTVRRAIVLHTPEPETFRAMLAEFRRYDVARFTYLENFLPGAEMASRCASEYVEDLLDRRSGAQVLEPTAHSYLLLLLQRHVVDVEDLAPALLDILETVARHEGYLPRGRTHQHTEDAHEQGADLDGQAAVARALSILGIRSGRPEPTQIRDAYRTLMRKYHPDINPDGLERSKQITSAYALLTDTFGSPSA